MASHDGFLLMRYKMWICYVILGELQTFRNYKGLSIIFSKILDSIWHESETFSGFHRNRIFESENFKFPPFSLRKKAQLGSEKWK